MSSRPFTILVAAGLEALIGLAVTIGGLYTLYAVFMGQAYDATSAIPLAAVGLAVGALLVFVAHGLWHLRDWARTPVVITQIFLAVIAYYMFTGEQFVFGTVLLFVAVVTAAAVLSPPTNAALFPDAEERG